MDKEILETIDEIREEIGNVKVIRTNCVVNSCDCGRAVTMKAYISIDEGMSYDVFATTTGQPTVGNYDKKYLGFCECGNIFIKK